MKNKNAPSDPGLPRGREREIRSIARVIESARTGHGGSLVIHGEPGIGKTTLLDHAINGLKDARVLRATGVQFETEFAFAGLHQLCSPLLDRIVQLPSPQRDALNVALGFKEGEAHSQFRAVLGVLGLLSAQSQDGLVVCVVDDTQWLDRASTQTLGFVARRIGAQRVAMFFALPDPDDAPELQGLPRLTVEGLAELDARALLDAHVHAPLDDRVRGRILAESRGNPRALLELPRSVGPAQLAGGFGLPDAVSPTNRLQRDVRARLDSLPEDTRQLLLLAAAEPLGDPHVLRSAAGKIGIDFDSAVAPAIGAAMAELGICLNFRDANMRAAVYSAAAPHERRRVHSALAKASPSTLDADRRAWHLARATAGIDEDVATQLEQSVTGAQAHGGMAAAAAFLEEAVRLTPDVAGRARRALAAAEAKRAAGAPKEASQLLSLVGTRALTPLQQVRSEQLRAQISFDLRRDSASAGALWRAARLMAPLDASRSGGAHVDAYAAAIAVGRFNPPQRLRDMAESVNRLPVDPEPRSPRDLLLNALTIRFADGRVKSVPPMRRAVHAYLRATGPDSESTFLTWMASRAALDCWNEEAWRILADRGISLARRSGELANLPTTLNIRAMGYIYAGKFSSAEALIREAYAITEVIGVPAQPQADLLLTAWRGDTERTVALAQKTVQRAKERGEGYAISFAELAQVVLHNGLGRHQTALDVCRTNTERDEFALHTLLAPEIIEAAVLSGQPLLATSLFQHLQEHTRSSSTEWAAGTEVHLRALLAEGSRAENLHLEALSRLADTDAVVHHARAVLAYGEWLLRQGRRDHAQTQLDAAHSTFSAMGAQAFSQRAASGLRACDAGRRRESDATTDDLLTAKELQIARFVAAGGTTKEVAADLFLSPRTVEAHLRSIFRKLNIKSRRELRHHVGQ